MDGKPVGKTLKRTVSISYRDGVYAQVYQSLSGSGSVFLTKFAIMLGAGPFHFGLLTAIGQLSQLFQLLGVAVTRRLNSRKNVVVVLALIGRAVTFLLGALPFFLPYESALWVFLGVFLLSTSIQAVGNNAWLAWISDMIPLRLRGRFFSVRTQYLVIAGLVVGFIFGGLLDLFQLQPDNALVPLIASLHLDSIFNPGNLPYFFLFIFFFASVVGLIGARILSRMPERPKPVEDEKLLHLLSIPMRDKNFRRLLVFGLWWMMALGVGSPFWQPFMIEHLHMSMVEMTAYGAISTFAAILMLRPWGKFIDRFGNRTSMVFAIIMGGFNPLVWLFAHPGSYWFIYLEAATSGTMWSGANIIATNFVLAVSPDSRRQVYSGVFGAFCGLAMMITILLSGAITTPGISLFGLDFIPMQVQFGLTGFLRWTCLIPLFWINENRTRPVSEAFNLIMEVGKARIANVFYWVADKVRVTRR